jgi:hypothetical protein
MALGVRIVASARRSRALLLSLTVAMLVITALVFPLLRDSKWSWVPTFAIVGTGFAITGAIFCHFRVKAAKQIAAAIQGGTMTAALVRKVLAMRRSIPKPPKNAHEKVHLNKLAKLGTFDQVVEAALAVEFAQKLKRKKKRRDKKKRAGMPAVGNRIVPSDGTEAEMAAAAEPEAPASVMAQARSLMAAEAEEEDRALSPLTLTATANGAVASVAAEAAVDVDAAAAVPEVVTAGDDVVAGGGPQQLQEL